MKKRFFSFLKNISWRTHNTTRGMEKPPVSRKKNGHPAKKRVYRDRDLLIETYNAK
jgi:hypothetical protein